MQCIECGGEYSERYDKYTGRFGDTKVTVEGYLYYECNKCGNILLSPSICDALENKRKEQTTK